MKTVKKALAAAVISVACGSAMASSMPAGTIDVYDGMSVANVFTSTTFSANDPTFYELNVTDSNGALAYFSLIDTDNDFHDVTYTLTSDDAIGLNAIEIGSQLFFQTTITDNNIAGPQGTFTQFLAAGQYVLKIATNQAFSSSSQVSAVPLPAAAWLFGSALLGMGLFRRRKQSAAAAV